MCVIFIPNYCRDLTCCLPGCHRYAPDRWCPVRALDKRGTVTLSPRTEHRDALQCRYVAPGDIRTHLDRNLSRSRPPHVTPMVTLPPSTLSLSTHTHTPSLTHSHRQHNLTFEELAMHVRSPAPVCVCVRACVCVRGCSFSLG